jgi:hypothetical protein
MRRTVRELNRDRVDRHVQEEIAREKAERERAARGEKAETFSTAPIGAPAEWTECDCGGYITATPEPTDDAAWEAISAEHAPWCEWVARRGVTLGLD